MRKKIAAIPSPTFVIEEKKLRKNLALIKRVQDRAGIEIILAFKAFANWKVFPIIREYITGATASSLYEARLCVEEMKALAHTYSPAYLSGEFEGIMKRSSHLTFNSIGQYEKFKAKVESFKKRDIKCGIRINPEYSEVETDLYNPAAPGSRLGEVAANFQELPAGITGLHCHNLCESDSFALENTLEHIEQKFGHFLPQIDWLNLGGGHLMTRKGYDTNHLIRILKAFKEKHQLHIILEPGSAFAWQTGFLRATVLDITNNHGIQTAVLDVSFTAHMPDTLEMPYRPVIRGAVEKSDHGYRMGGVSCLAGDYLETYYFEKPLKIGDAIVLEDMIHYTMVKTTMFNGVKHPNIALLQTDGSLDVFREFTYRDFKNRLS